MSGLDSCAEIVLRERDVRSSEIEVGVGLWWFKRVKGGEGRQRSWEVEEGEGR